MCARPPSFLFLAPRSPHKCGDLGLGIPEGSQAWLMVHLQVPCTDFQNRLGVGEGRRRSDVRLKPFTLLPSPSLWSETVYFTDVCLGALGKWQLK